MTTRSFAIAVSMLIAAAASARADAPAPTNEQLAAAKQLFEDGDALYKQGRLAEAVEKLKQAYRLSNNAYLLYNIGHTYDQLDDHELVIFYFKKFLAAAPADAPMRPAVVQRIAELEAEAAGGSSVLDQFPDPDPADAGASAKAPPPAIELRHNPIASTPPGSPLDLSAWVPDGTNVRVTLYYRSSGVSVFTAKPMVRHQQQLVARVPMAKIVGTSIQYYVEVKDLMSGQVVARHGRSVSPNLVLIDKDAPARYFPDYVDDDTAAVVQVDPLGNQPPPDFGEPLVTPPPAPQAPYATAKWVASGSAVALIGTAGILFVVAGNQHDALAASSVSCGQPPCRAFDHDLESRGILYDRMYKVSLGLGLATAAVAGFLWYRNAQGPKRTDAADRDDLDLALEPVIGDGYAGARAAARF